MGRGVIPTHPVVPSVRVSITITRQITHFGAPVLQRTAHGLWAAHVRSLFGDVAIQGPNERWRHQDRSPTWRIVVWKIFNSCHCRRPHTLPSQGGWPWDLLS